MRKYWMLFNLILLVICFSSCGVQKVKDEDAAYDIIHAWIDEYNPISDEDELFFVESGAAFQIQNIEGDDYYSCEINVFYRNKLYRVMSGDIYKNAIAEGTAYVRVRDGAIFVEFEEDMEPIEEWYASFDNWVFSVAPVGYDRFIIAPTVHDFVNYTDYSNPYRQGWVYVLSWESMDIAKGYEVEYTESYFGDDESYKEIYEEEGTVVTVGGSVTLGESDTVIVRVRAYVEEDGERIYGGWSEPHSIILGSDDPAEYWNVTWQDIMRYPESYIDELVQLPKVTVLQDVGNGLYRVWDNDLKVYVIDTSNVSGTKILESDSLLIQGKYVGLKTFNMTDGSTEDYPYVMVNYYEILNLN